MNPIAGLEWISRLSDKVDNIIEVVLPLHKNANCEWFVFVSALDKIDATTYINQSMSPKISDCPSRTHVNQPNLLSSFRFRRKKNGFCIAGFCYRFRTIGALTASTEHLIINWKRRAICGKYLQFVKLLQRIHSII